MNLQKIKQELNEKLSFATSDNTRKRYLQSIIKFLNFVKKEHPSKDEIIQYINFLKSKGYVGNYLIYNFMTIKKYFEIFKYDWEFGVNEIPTESHPTRLILTKEMAFKLLELSKKNKKHYAIFNFAFLCGPRRAEIINLNREDYDGNKIYIRTLKRGNPRSIDLNDETKKAIDEYLKTRKDDKKSLFRIASPHDLSLIFHEYAKKLGLKKGYGIHSIRRSLVTWLYEQGLKELEIQDYMGWKSANMVHVYAQLNQKELQSKIKKVHPIFPNGNQ